MRTGNPKRWLILPALMLLGVVLGPALAGGTPGVIGGAVVGAITGLLLIWVLTTKALSSTWLYRVHRSAQLAYVLLLLVGVYGLIAGTLTVLLWQPGASWDAFNRPYQLQGIGMLLVLLLSLPALVTAAWYASHRDWQAARQFFLAFAGPVLVFVIGDGLTPHLEIPWHHLAHTLSGLLPMMVLYTLALRKWYPSLLNLRQPPGQQNVPAS
jgi:hypothetical protein